MQNSAEPDGVRVLKHRLTTGDASQFFVSTKPHVAPKALIRSVKGRLQHAIRQQVLKAFQRNYALRGFGAATRSVIEQYVADQLGHHRMADPNVQQRLARFQKPYPDVDLSLPSFSAHGEYWYNLHVVLVSAERWMESRERVLEERLTAIEATVAKCGHRLSRAAVPADHVHLTLGYMNACGEGRGRGEAGVDVQ